MTYFAGSCFTGGRVVAVVASVVLLAACGSEADRGAVPATTSAPAADTAEEGAPAAADTADKAPTHIGTVTQSSSACTLEADETLLRAGPVTLAVVNETDGLAFFSMGRLGEGSTYDQLDAYIQEDRELAEAGEPGLGHPMFLAALFQSPRLEAGASGTMELRVSEGTYGIVCLQTFEGWPGPRPFAVVGPLEVE